MIYLDSSALVKLVFEEKESAALADWLSGHQDLPLISSALATVEVLRTCRKINPVALWLAQRIVDGLDLVAVDADVIRAAALLEPSELRSLDALHLASALSVGSATVTFVSYVVRLSEAAAHAGLAVASPE